MWRMVSMMNALPLMSVPLVSVGSVIHNCHVVTKICCSHLPRQSLSSSEAVSPDAVLCVGVPTLPAFLLLMPHQAVLEEEHLGGFSGEKVVDEGQQQRSVIQYSAIQNWPKYGGPAVKKVLKEKLVRRQHISRLSFPEGLGDFCKSVA